MNDRKVKQVLPGGGYQWGVRYKGRMKEGKDGRIILYACIKRSREGQQR
jgi:hypothetical protein